MTSSTLYILYNANASIMGKLNYTCRKLLSSSTEDPACAACDITHGGLHLNESEAWTQAKRRVSGVEIKQLHRDELVGEDSGVCVQVFFRPVPFSSCALRLFIILSSAGNVLSLPNPTSQIKAFIAQRQLQYPIVLLKRDQGEPQKVMTREELAECKGSPEEFLTRLKGKQGMGFAVADGSTTGGELSRT